MGQHVAIGTATEAVQLPGSRTHDLDLEHAGVELVDLAGAVVRSEIMVEIEDVAPAPNQVGQYAASTVSYP